MCLAPSRKQLRLRQTDHCVRGLIEEWAKCTAEDVMAFKLSGFYCADKIGLSATFVCFRDLAI